MLHQYLSMTVWFLVCSCILLPFTTAQTCSASSEDRTDCGYAGVDQSSCEARGCCWAPVNPNPNNIPWCYYANSSFYATCEPTVSRLDCAKGK